jgi:ubiquinone/menaquinone biosynthesis C-methylase UbiE
MSEYLNEKPLDWCDPQRVAMYDELPLWSAMAGLLLLEHVPLAPGARVLDVGFGTGFPLLELAQRLGPGSLVAGIDPWAEAGKRATAKAGVLGITNVEMVTGDAASMPWPDGHFGLIVSNLGLNNFADPHAALRECYRVARPGATIAIATNLRGHMCEFYEVFEATLRELRRDHDLERLQTHVDHRATVEGVKAMLRAAGFVAGRHELQTMTMRFADGSAMLRHTFIRVAFLDGWRQVLCGREEVGFFQQLEANLNRRAHEQGELRLTIPLAYVEGRRAE